MASEFAIDDPAGWSVDRVIETLCRNPVANWAGSGLSLPIPRPEEVEHAFRSHDIDGDVLVRLEASDLEQMNLRSVGQLNKLRRVIKFLRSVSTIYINENGRDMSASITQTIEQSTSLQPEMMRASSEKWDAHPSSTSRLSFPGSHLLDVNKASSVPIPGASSNLSSIFRHPHRPDQPGAIAKPDLDMLDVVSENLEAQRVRSENQTSVKRIVPTTLPLAQNKRYSDGTGSDILKRARYSFGNSEANLTGGKDTRLLPPDVPTGASSDFKMEGSPSGASDSDSSYSPAQDMDLGPYQQLLDRYPVQEDDDDDGLPTYGESDNEGFEITDDSDSQQSDEMPTEMPGSLSAKQVNSIMDEAIQTLQKRWQLGKLVAAHKRAYKQWRGTAGDNKLRQFLIQKTKLSLDHVLARLIQLRDAVQHSAWNNPEDVKRQCECLEATVYQQQEYLYSISILESDQMPDRPTSTPPNHSKPLKVKTVEGDIICESDSTGSLNDFVSSDSLDYSEGSALDESTDVDGRESNGQQSAPKLVLHTSMPDSVAEPRMAIDSNPFNDQVAFFNDKPQFPNRQTEHNDVNHAHEVLPQTPRRSRITHDDAGDADDEDGDVPISSSKRRTSAKSRAAVEGRTRNPLSLPSLPSGDSDTDSDLDRSPRVSRTRLRKFGKSSVEPIVLTSSPAQSSGEMAGSDMVFDEVRTPELNPVNIDQADVKAVKALASPPSINKKLENLTMPDLNDARQIPWKILKKEPDEHGLALAKTLLELNEVATKTLLQYIIPLTLTDVEETVHSGISAIQSDGDQKIDVPAAKQEIAMLLTLAFMSYANVDNMTKEDASDQDCDTAWALLKDRTYDHADAFLRILLRTLRQLVNEPRKLAHVAEAALVDDATPEDSTFENITELESDTSTNVRKTQKSGKNLSGTKAGTSSTSAALDTQRLAKKRVEHQQYRKTLINQKLARLADRSGDVIQVPVNFKEPLVLLDQHIARRIKPHQKKGVEFIWRELIEDPQHQGCLLAHTMGLGKTMQVIATLVTIAQCLKSNDERIQAYIPPHMRDLRIIILSPPALCENWFDELMFWMPEHDTLGPICKITSQTKQPYYDIKQWSEAAGVLLLGYDRLVSYTRTPHRLPADSDEQYAFKLGQTEDMSRWLLQTPSIVVADEAHMLKNPASKRAEVALRFRTESRIALTGSPLSNHLEEYWAMINFIAPGYLDEQGKFKNKFVEPINRCLSVESSSFDRRLGLKKMHVLRTILEPKVNRADITAIQNDLPAKTEFFITVPLSDLQFKMYKLCVDYFRGVSTETSGRARTASLWQWISVLSLLCNHPWTFQKKLSGPGRRNRGKHSLREGSDDLDDEEAGTQARFGDEVDNSDQPAMLQAMDIALKSALEALPPGSSSLSSPSMSYRMLLVQAIVKESLILGEKLLIFSHSLLTLDYVELVLDDLNCPFERIDGGVATDKRQRASKEFNAGLCKAQAFLISTRAGGLGLNLFGATRVIILDYSFNPSWEEQAIGRAYRLGQKEPVFVYRFRSGGTFEDSTFNQTIFKTQLFTRIIDHKAVLRKSSKLDAARYLMDPQMPQTEDFSESKGKDPQIMDKLIAHFDCIRNIVLTETFAQDIQETLTPHEIAEADREVEDERLARNNPDAYSRRLAAREAEKYLQHDRSKMRASFKQGELSAPSQILTGLLNNQTRDPHFAQTQPQPHQLPAVLQDSAQQPGYSYDDNIVATRTQPANTDGTSDVPHDLQGRQQERQNFANISSRSCNTQ